MMCGPQRLKASLQECVGVKMEEEEKEEEAESESRAPRQSVFPCRISRSRRSRSPLKSFDKNASDPVSPIEGRNRKKQLEEESSPPLQQHQGPQQHLGPKEPLTSPSTPTKTHMRLPFSIIQWPSVRSLSSQSSNGASRSLLTVPSFECGLYRSNGPSGMGGGVGGEGLRVDWNYNGSANQMSSSYHGVGDYGGFGGGGEMTEERRCSYVGVMRCTVNSEQNRINDNGNNVEETKPTNECERDVRESESVTSPLLDSSTELTPDATTNKETITPTMTSVTNEKKMRQGRKSSKDLPEERNEEAPIGFPFLKPKTEKDHFPHANERVIAEAAAAANTKATATAVFCSAPATMDVDNDEGIDARSDPNDYKGTAYDVNRRSYHSYDGAKNVQRIDVIDPWGYVQASTPIMREEDETRRGGRGRGRWGRRGRKFWKRCEGSDKRSIFASMKHYINTIKVSVDTSGNVRSRSRSGGSGGGGGGGGGAAPSISEDAALSSLEDWSKRE